MRFLGFGRLPKSSCSDFEMASSVASALNALANDSFDETTVEELQEFIADFFETNDGDFSGML